MPTILRLGTVVAVAAIMGWAGMYVIDLTTPVSPTPLVYLLQAAVSAGLWLLLSRAVAVASLPVTLGIGMISPFAGSMLFCPPYSLLLVAHSPQSLLVGAVTALAVKAVVSLDTPRQRRLRRGLCPRCAYDLRSLSSKVCPECGLDVENVSSGL